MSAIDVSKCSRCRNSAILFQEYSGQHYCSGCLIRSVRKRIGKELRKQLILPKSSEKELTTILVAISGGKDSAVLLETLHHFLKNRKDVKLIAGCVNEGIKGYRQPSMECAEKLSETLGIEFKSVSYTSLGFDEMDNVVELMPKISEKNEEVKGMSPCSFCGVFRRQGINQLANDVNADYVALGHNLDDMAQTVLMNLQKGDLERTIRLAPHSWSPIRGMSPRIVPIRWIPEQEVQAYAMTLDLPFHDDECPHSHQALRILHRDIIAQMEDAVPGTRHGLVHSSDSIKEMFKNTASNDEIESIADKSAKNCKMCGGITSQDICKACVMKKWLVEHSQV
ncbi:MAG: TIGR00269 family protein [Euryarchaeota archaeon]|nr:TIGR00269 family protein [Euryarchaeota archaeon]|tara:strand:+ start:867 stop:1880 length:1014 start_codon:yes stop_codon:yes gene_type:complete